MSFVEFRNGGLPVYSWAPDLEEGAKKQALNCAQLPVAFHHVAVMADGHQGYGVPIGAVLALDGAISPYAVGNDIGCGMGLLPTAISRRDLLAPVRTRSGGTAAAARDDIMGWVQSTIPAGAGSAGSGAVVPSEINRLLNDAFGAMREASALCRIQLSTSQSFKAAGGRPLTAEEFGSRGRSQAGTLGAGNHFIELLCGPDDRVAVLIHSGSRGVGGLVCANFHRMALFFAQQAGHHLPDPGLAWLPVGEGGEGKWERVGGCYQHALEAALHYAERNRRLMLERVGEIIEKRFPKSLLWEELINIHHNDAAFEQHYGRKVWVHRKGAVKASAGTPTITPGSMGTFTVLGKGLGNPASFSSCSHGAGRMLSRGKAREALSLTGELQRITAAGGKVFASSKAAVLDEMPGAYKDLDRVMANQSDLVDVTARYTPLATYKGTEQHRRRGGRGRRRHGEER